ncbi:hypothetical protein MJO28_004608 [Puccinia striiformis f. sp. tritici]|uniref:Uncharacterized protein n=1 Tax=Puccinia striiformis f. sp. tritici TaxID=168172 RepID=A0ACC0EP88_9BASI|nr:hypothetical protein MJO28_004608 [Puccinia striiformis f. sp. tritici]KAI7963261.1 hypothetical protein MJO29_003688 [Puccinia striiformis f. sp. tritici]
MYLTMTLGRARSPWDWLVVLTFRRQRYLGRKRARNCRPGTAGATQADIQATRNLGPRRENNAVDMVTNQKLEEDSKDNDHA